MHAVSTSQTAYTLYFNGNCIYPMLYAYNAIKVFNRIQKVRLFDTRRKYYIIFRSVEDISTLIFKDKKGIKNLRI